MADSVRSAEGLLAPASDRLVSLDVFRGLTIAGMVLVNNPGSWGSLYWPLGHAEWDGWTPTDWVFPFFLFIVGVALTFSFDRRIARGQSRLRLFEQVVRRTVILFFLGMTLGGFPNFRLITPYILTMIGLNFLYHDEPIFGRGATAAARRNKAFGWGLLAVSLAWFLGDFAHFNSPVRGSTFGDMFPLTNEVAGGRYIRVPGVLQRIAVCYFFTCVIVLRTGLRGRLAWTLGLIAAYWAIMKYVQAPGGYTIGGPGLTPDAPPEAPFPGGLNDWLDVKLLGAHLYTHRPDPEGILSTLPAIATALAGVLTGQWLHVERPREAKAGGMFGAGLVLLVIGWAMSLGFPINKKIWSSSYVVFMAGWALVFLAACYYFIDARGWRRWAGPFVVFGTNPIFIFFGSGLMARLMGMIRWESDEKKWNVHSWVYDNLITSWITAPKMASLVFALAFITLWLVITYPLYRKKIFLKI